MAKSKEKSVSMYIKTVRKKRPGIHSKKKHSNKKTSKNYVKSYRGQGR